MPNCYSRHTGYHNKVCHYQRDMDNSLSYSLVRDYMRDVRPVPGNS